jgi:hypothetical protein
MKVVDISAMPYGGDTKSLQTLGSLLGLRPEMSKSVVTLYPNLTLTALTESLGKVYGMDGKAKNMTPIKNTSYEWMIKTHQIPIIRIAEDCTATGEAFAEIPIIMDRKYYSPHDTFKLENEQQCFVTRKPEMVAPGKFRYWVKIVGNNISERLNITYLTKGRGTQYVSNYFPELSERGYNKFMYNIEKHRNYISRHRVGDSRSGDWAVLEEIFMEHAGMYFKSDKFEKQLMDLFYLSRERSFVFGKCNFDILGKCYLQDDEGRDIPMGDGLIEQLKKFCSQQTYTTMTRAILDDAISDVVSKLPKKTGNTIVCMTGFHGYQTIGRLLESILLAKEECAYFYTVEGKKIKVGAEFSAYTFQGNTIVFTVNEAFDTEISDVDSDGHSLWSQSYVFFDTGTYDGEPNVSLITLDGRSMITGNLRGMGGMSGKENGDIATTVDGSRVEILGYSSLKVANPYAAHIIRKVVV